MRTRKEPTKPSLAHSDAGEKPFFSLWDLSSGKVEVKQTQVSLELFPRTSMGQSKGVKL